MRESRTSGSEGGAACGLSLPLSWSAPACRRHWRVAPFSNHTRARGGRSLLLPSGSRVRLPYLLLLVLLRIALWIRSTG